MLKSDLSSRPSMLTPRNLGIALRQARVTGGMSQPTAAREADVSTRLWSEVERGLRPNVSFTTLVRMCEVMGVTVGLGAVNVQPPRATKRLSPAQIEALRQDLRRAAAYGVDIARIQEGIILTPREHAERNDEALAFFRGVKLTPGWKSSESKPAGASRGAGR